MTKNDLMKKIYNSSNIYSFVVALYMYIEQEKTRIIRRDYKISVADKNKTADLNAIGELARELCFINQFEFQEWIVNWVQEFSKTNLKDKVFCYISLLKIDEIICELTTFKKTVVCRGPLNDDEEYLFYYKPTPFFLSERLKKGGIRYGRQTVEYDVDSLNMDFNNFEVIKYTKLYDYRPIVNQYNHNTKFSDELKIGVSPFSSKKWFTIHKENITKELLVEYNNSTTRLQNNHLKKLLVEFEKQQVNIVVFPELVMNPETEEDIRKFMLEANFRYIKLCFMGSVWNNNINESLVISGQGTILAHEQKKTPYKLYDKDERCYYTEAISDNAIIHFIDLEGMGRIAYLICADFNNDSINAVCSLMHANFIFVSAFTNSTNTMLGSANSYAERKAVATVLCNSCAALVGEGNSDSYAAFGVIPEAQDKCLIVNDIYKAKACWRSSECECCVKTFAISKAGG